MNNLIQIYKGSTLSNKLIFINIGIFVILKLAAVLFMLFNISIHEGLTYFEVPSSPIELLKQPWSIITYAFLHAGFFHILFNMLWLYWFGQLFLSIFTGKQMLGIYLLGAIAGAAMFVLAYNIFPYFTYTNQSSYLVGASAAVMAIVFAVSVYNPNLEIYIFLFGRIKLIYLALASFIIDFLSVTSSNAGGHFAHIGGALLGVLFALQYKKGKDISNIINKPIDWIVSYFPKPGKKRNMKVTYKKENIDWNYNEKKNKNVAEIDTILEKIKRSGYNSLTKEEKQKLFDAGNK
ncbi:MAG: rhomboid family intramembrane serine protease [Bacteroidales bacterium]|nr:rhomboid family intramembrane serine protease [Bacteroidales bacterium]